MKVKIVVYERQLKEETFEGKNITVFERKVKGNPKKKELVVTDGGKEVAVFREWSYFRHLG